MWHFCRVLLKGGKTQQKLEKGVGFVNPPENGPNRPKVLLIGRFVNRGLGFSNVLVLYACLANSSSVTVLSGNFAHVH